MELTIFGKAPAPHTPLGPSSWECSSVLREIKAYDLPRVAAVPVNNTTQTCRTKAEQQNKISFAECSPGQANGMANREENPYIS
jgi:hypothetical protein